MEPTPPQATPRPERDPVDVDPDLATAKNDQTDQDVDTTGTEADEPAVGSALDRGVEGDERRRPQPDRP